MSATRRLGFFAGPGWGSLGGDACFLAATATCLKLLLVPSYRSTDFEVHRNWLAVTSSLPLSQWYVDETSPWTLDYPPLFAWFERLLAVFAGLVDPTMVDLRLGLNHASNATILFQRSTVMVSDLLLAYAAYRYCRSMAEEDTHRQGQGHQRAALLLGAVLLLPGLLIVDHIHFQYNGLLLGLLLLSLSLLREGQDWASGAVFAVLCCMKHLFAVAGPWYAVFLLRAHCLAPPVSTSRVLTRALTLTLTVALVLAATFAPFIALGQMGQVLSRLFPFGRGLCHAYWAPNAWALYNAADKLLVVLLVRSRQFLSLPLPPSVLDALREAQAAGPSFTRGLVGQGSGTHAILPSITPGSSLALVLASMLPALVQVWRCPEWHRKNAASSLAYVFLCAFLFGWHVHEKAALHFLVLYALTAMDSWDSTMDFIYISAVANYSLFPLLFGSAEYPIKVLLLILYLGEIALLARESVLQKENSQGRATGKGPAGFFAKSLWSSFCFAHGSGLVLLEVYNQIFHPFLLGQKYEFLPLMLTSVYCSLGVFAFFLKQTIALLLVE